MRPAAVSCVRLARAALISALSFALLAPASRAQPADAAWSLLPDIAAEGRALAYDSARHRLLMFGGFDTPLFRNEVWSLALDDPAGGWQQLVAAGTPPAGRRDASAFYDPVADRLIVIGGVDRSTVRSDMVWQLALDGTPTWSEIVPAGVAPPALVARAAAFDPATSRVLLFGGTYGAASDRAFVLSLAGAPAWSEVVATGAAPSGRYHARATFDAARGRFVVFGGIEGNGNLPGDLWGLRLDPEPAWTPIGASGLSIALATIAHDPVNDRLLVYDLGRASPTAWAMPYAGGPAVLVTSADLPAGVTLPACLPTPAGGAALLVARRPLDDVWRLPLGGPGGWTRLAESEPDPGPRFSHTVVLDAPRARLVLFGGRGNWLNRLHRETPVYGDVMVRLPGGTWRPIAPIGTGPSPRHEHSAIYDPVRERMIVFGGQTGEAGPASSEVLTLSLAGTPAWERLSITGAGPPARWGHVAAYDAAHDRMLVFGGGAGTSAYADTWALSLGGTPAWQLVAPAPPMVPPIALWPRVDAAGIVDPVRDRLIVTGGSTVDGSVTLSDQWELNLSGTPAWRPLATTAPTPGALAGHAALYDAARDRMLVVGGGSAAEAQVWELGLGGAPEWRALQVSGVPPRGRRDAGVAWGAAGDAVVVTGGRGACDLSPSDCVYPWRALADAWTVELAAPTPTTVALVSARAAGGRVELAWDAAGLGGPFVVERREERDAWGALGEAWAGGDGLVRWTDAGVTPGARYGYRLALPGGAVAGETWIEVPAAARLAMAGPRPNPASGDVAVEFTLAGDGPALVEVYDVGGRRVASRDLGSPGAGRHVVRLAGGRGLAAGVYVFVVRQGGAVATARGVVAR